MTKEISHSVADFVEVSYCPDLKAVCLKWFSEYDEGTHVKDAVNAALDYVREHNVQHWLAEFGDQIIVKLSNDLTEIRSFFLE